MTLYSILLIMFGLGGFGVYRATKKQQDPVEITRQWTKFATYFILVFGQVLLISQAQYKWIGLIIIIGGFYEIILIRKSIKTLLFALILYLFLAFGYLKFFELSDVKWQQFLFITVITFDGYSQISGQLFGRTKVFPNVSPNKTLEGLAGGFLSVLITSFVLSGILDIAVFKALISSMIIALFSVAGDFLASFYKRKCGVKDFSRIIPGHGGILDRFDSLITAAFGLLLMQFITSGNSEIWNYIAYILIFLMLFFVAEIGYKTFKIKVEFTRKFVHIFSGLVCLTFPIFLNQWLSVFGLCLSFIGLLILSKKFVFLPSINAIDRKSNGSILFPIAILVCFLFFSRNHDYVQFYLPVLLLAVCDPMAALFGKRWPYGKYKVGSDFKTLVGSATFFVSCFVILMTAFSFSDARFTFALILNCLIISGLTTGTEAFSKNGFDNLTIPLSVILALYFWNF